ncbi:hypothetical protein MTR67_039243 [Solanum verrucosum]|uniref:Uncharacterized protein n=1 Tax=Solanum verrucosum TaxID=315347 RepID=A0AAF0ZQ79_SOLVR|nr:hypothetical protein MTR67_039243 [Solanum verrucosum]
MKEVVVLKLLCLLVPLVERSILGSVYPALVVAMVVRKMITRCEIVLILWLKEGMLGKLLIVVLVLMVKQGIVSMLSYLTRKQIRMKVPVSHNF